MHGLRLDNFPPLAKQTGILVEYLISFGPRKIIILSGKKARNRGKNGVISSTKPPPNQFPTKISDDEVKSAK